MEATPTDFGSLIPWCVFCMVNRHDLCEPVPWCECSACLPHDEEEPPCR